MGRLRRVYVYDENILRKNQKGRRFGEMLGERWGFEGWSL